jgi:hypothetical protein
VEPKHVNRFDNFQRRKRHAVAQCAAMVLLFLCVAAAPAAGQNDLATIRAEVQGTQPQAIAPPQNPSPSRNVYDPEKDQEDNAAAAFFNNGGWAIVGGTLLAPYWGPRAILHDESCDAYFPKFPYNDTPGYLTSESWIQCYPADKLLAGLKKDAEQSPWSSSGGSATEPPDESLALLSPDRTGRCWACQFRADYLSDFHNLDGVAAQFLVETTSRWGVETSVEYFNEHLLNDGNDHLLLGDCNVTYRFAQHPRAQMRVGVGLNWLNDASRTDFGFNCTYGGDFFPAKPWVLSAEIDGGTLGDAGLFRFRTTAGVLLDRFETYVGYEYLDIGSTRCNFLIAGLRVWF